MLPLEEDLDRALAERVRAPFDTDWQTDPRSVVIRVQLPEGVLHVEAPRKRLFTATLYLFVIWLVGSALLLSAVAVLFMKNQVRAIRRLADAAEAFGLGRDIGAIKPEGATEARQAAAAFNQMRERIRRFVVAAHGDAGRHQPRPAHPPHPHAPGARHAAARGRRSRRTWRR